MFDSFGESLFGRGLEKSYETCLSSSKALDNGFMDVEEVYSGVARICFIKAPQVRIVIISNISGGMN